MVCATSDKERLDQLLKQRVDGSIGVLLAGFAADPDGTMCVSGEFPQSLVQCDVRGKPVALRWVAHQICLLVIVAAMVQ